MKIFLFLKVMVLVLMASISLAFAGEVDVLDVVAKKTGAQTYSFSVTVEHGDEGWDHYADKWDVLTEAGEVLGTRVLAHPHVNEQPFTRSLSSVKVPNGTKSVIIRAHDSVHAYGGKELIVTLP